MTAAPRRTLTGPLRRKLHLPVWGDVSIRLGAALERGDVVVEITPTTLVDGAPDL